MWGGCCLECRQYCYRGIPQGNLNCNSLEVRVHLDLVVVESLLYINRDSSTWQLVRISSQRLKIAVIITTLVVTWGRRMLQFGFLQAYNIRLMLTDQDIEIPHYILDPEYSTAGSRHYVLVCFVVLFLWFRISAGFVIGEVTGILHGPFLFNSFFLELGDCLYI